MLFRGKNIVLFRELYEIPLYAAGKRVLFLIAAVSVKSINQWHDAVNKTVLAD